MPTIGERQVSFIAFEVEEVNCSVQTESRSVDMINERLVVQETNGQTSCGGLIAFVILVECKMFTCKWARI